MAGSRPHILLVGGDGGNSGVPRHMLHLANSLGQDAVITLVSDENEGGFDRAAAAGAQHHVIPGLQTRRSLRHLWAGLSGLTRYLRTRKDADLVWLHARIPVLMGRLALALRLWHPNGRVAVTFHGLPFGAGHKPRNSRFSKALEKGLLRLCPSLDLIFLSQDMADRMTAAMGARRMARHRVHVLPNCSDLGALPAATKSAGKTLVMTGRAGWQKNYPLAVKVLAHLPPDYHLTLCGAGTDEPSFQNILLGEVPEEVGKRIHFAGPLRDVRSVLSAAQGYMLCSRYEGLPIGALEAFEAGLPVILSRFDGAEALAQTSPFARVLDFDGLDRDALEIDALIRAFHAHPESSRTAVQTAWAETWSPEIFAKRSRALLQKLL